MRYRALLGILLAAWCAWPMVAGAAPLPRTVLAIYDGRGGADALALSPAHRYAQAPLNYLGLSVRYWNLADGLPDAAALEGVRGVLLWCEGCESHDPSAWYGWLAQVAERGLRVVLIGSPWQLRGTQGAAPADSAVKALLQKLGLASQGRAVDVTYRVRSVRKESAMVEFERRWADPWPPFGIYSPADRRLRSYLVVADAAAPGVESHVVVTGPRGGFVESGYAVYPVLGSSMWQWRIDPFAFFSAALGIDAWPRIDAVTLSNEPVAFAQVDGAGWLRATELFRYRETGTLCSEVVLRELIEAYPGLPVSVAGATELLAGSPSGDARVQRLRDRLANLSQVELAQRPGSRPEESGLAVNEAPLHLAAAFGDWLGRFVAPRVGRAGDSDSVGAAAVSLWPGATAVSLWDWPAAVVDVDSEVRQERSALPQTTPPPPWLQGLSGSYTDVAPLLRPMPAGGSRVYGAIDAGPQVDPRQWRAALGRAETPRRLRPRALRYDMTSGCSDAALTAAREALDFLVAAPAVPVKPSAYAALVADAARCELGGSADEGWTLAHCGGVGTVRFDRASQRSVDFTRSRGVLGQRHLHGSLYVAIDPAVPEPRIVLGPPPAASDRPYLVSARWRIRDFAWTADGRFSFQAQGYGPGTMQWVVALPGAYEIVARQGDTVVWRQGVASDAAGRLSWSVAPLASAPVTIEVRPSSATAELRR